MSFLFPKAVYALCLVTSLVCAVLVARSYLQTRSGLLVCVALGFVALAFNNLFLVADQVLFPKLDLWIWRQLSAGAAVLVLLYGFTWTRDR